MKLMGYERLNALSMVESFPCFRQFNAAPLYSVVCPNYTHSIKANFFDWGLYLTFHFKHYMISPVSTDYRIISDHSFAVVRQNINNQQKGFFAQRGYLPGETVTTFSAREIVSEPNYLTVQVGESRHILLHPEHLQYINHSCDPNVFFDTGSLEIVALRVIEAGDEISFFYPSTEWDMAQPFSCHCGSPKCLSTIRGAAHIPDEMLSQYRLTNFIQQQLHVRSQKNKRA